MVTSRVAGLSSRQRLCKRAFDVAGAVIGLVLVGWLAALATVLARLDTGASGVYWQERIGRDGEPFRIYKIRTMRPAPGIDTTVTSDRDPRITRLGRVLRATKIDELPQLFNILRGDMSFVGPRPDVAGFADRLTGPERLVLSVRPGITGPATLAFRHEQRLLAAQQDPDAYNRNTLYRTKVRINYDYIVHYRFRDDLRYLWATVTGRRLPATSALTARETTTRPIRTSASHRRRPHVRPLVILGAGGHGREILDIIRAAQQDRHTHDFVGFLDDGLPVGDASGPHALPVLGGTDLLARLDVDYLIGIGLPAHRRRVDRAARAWGRRAACAIHPQASLGSRLLLGPGLVMAPGARMTTNITTGRHVHLNLNSTVSHDCVVGDYVTITPGVNVSGSVRVGDDVWLGTGATVNQEVSIGARTIIGAGGSVISDIPPGVTAVGVPARPLTRRAPSLLAGA
ncbi:MAG: NeuD/PglB/VioB family sugar acetyltransferase [Actinobacteria bacterium]|nr:NeuD/PglB/VioB family sugar acetyltransferase [Actinomycetota bacterium]